MDQFPMQRRSRSHDLAVLADFVVVAELEHMTRAAEVLGVPQSTLSRRLRRLEGSLGFPLLARRGRRIEVSQAGRELAEVARRAFAEVDREIVSLVEARDASHGVVTLAFLHTLGPVAVPAIIREFSRTQPGVRFRLVQEAHDEVVRQLRAGEVDVALTAPLPAEESVRALPLVEQRLCVVVPATHRLADRGSVGLRSLADEGFVGFKPGYGLRRITDEWCRDAGFVPRLAFEGDDVATVRGLVAAGLGIALLPASAPLGSGDTVEVEVTGPRRSRTIGMATVIERPLSPPAQAFHDFVAVHGGSLLAASSM